MVWGQDREVFPHECLPLRSPLAQASAHGPFHGKEPGLTVAPGRVLLASDKGQWLMYQARRVSVATELLYSIFLRSHKGFYFHAVSGWVQVGFWPCWMHVH